MEAGESDLEQALSCELVEDENQSGKSQGLICLPLLSWVFGLDAVRIYTIDMFLMRRPLVTSRRVRFLSLSKSRIHPINSVASCFAKSMLAFLPSASFDHRWMFAACLCSLRFLRPISRHMAHVFGTLVVELIERIPLDWPVRCTQMHLALKCPHLQSWHTNT
jgi:hypothetical protein